jgi:hypothetical protein
MLAPMSRQVLSAVLRSPELRRVVIAFAGFNFADWARWLAILVYAYQRGGAAESGAISLLQLLPAAIVAPLAANIGDRYSRDRMLVLAYGSQALSMGATGLALVAGAPAWVVYGLAILAVIATSLTRPAHASLLPGLAREPIELTSANVASGWAESLGILLGPAVAGLVLQGFGPGAVFLLAAAIMASGGALVASMRVGGPSRPRRRTPDARSPDPARGAEPPQDPDHGRPMDVGGFLGGFSALAIFPGPRTVVLVLGAAAALWGAIDVLNVAVAIDVMRTGPSGAGILGASLGVGGIVGSALAATLVGRPRIGPAFVVGLLAWGVPLIGIAVAPTPLVAIALLIVAGTGRSVMDVAGRTLLQRAAPEEVLSRIFGVLEGMFLGSFGIGSIVVAGLITTQGPRGALVLAGLWLPTVVLLAWRGLRAIDAEALVPTAALGLLRAIPMFAPLGAPTLERLARSLTPIDVAAGTWIIREGEAGDQFYVVESGTVEVSIGGRVVRVDGPSSSFGEIALLRDIPRTASVRAVTNVRLQALERKPFLTAVTGTASSRRAAEALVAERLAR